MIGKLNINFKVSQFRAEWNELRPILDQTRRRSLQHLPLHFRFLPPAAPDHPDICHRDLQHQQELQEHREWWYQDLGSGAPIQSYQNGKDKTLTISHLLQRKIESPGHRYVTLIYQSESNKTCQRRSKIKCWLTLNF